MRCPASGRTNPSPSVRDRQAQSGTNSRSIRRQGQRSRPGRCRYVIVTALFRTSVPTLSVPVLVQPMYGQREVRAMRDGLMNSSGTRAIEDRQYLPLVGRLLRGRYAFTAVTLATAALGGAVGGAAGGLPELLLGATGGLLAQLSSRVVEAMVETGKVRRGSWAASGDDPGSVDVEAVDQAVDQLLPR